MADFFSLQLQGKGTADVESLGSYLFRLGDLHGLTVYQLFDCLSNWARSKRLVDCDMPRNLLYSRSMAICAYGSQLQVLVRALELATGETDLSAATFLALNGIVSRNCCGVVKHHRAWCPACFATWRRHGDICYDKLQWCAKDMVHCAEHNIRLSTRCANCGELQKFYTSVKHALDICVRCGNCLGEERNLNHSKHHLGFGEPQLIELIGAIAKNPDIKFVSDPLCEFHKQAAQQFVQQHVGDIDLLRYMKALSSVRKGSVPSFRSLLRISVAADVPITLLLSSPQDAAKIVPIDGTWGVKVPSVNRLRHGAELKDLVRSTLRGVANQARHSQVPALSTIGRVFGVSLGYIYYHFPKLVRTYRSNKCAYINQKAFKMRWTVRLYAKEVLLPRYHSGTLRTHDDIVRELVRIHAVSVRFARESLSWALDGKSRGPRRAEYRAIAEGILS